MSEEAVVGKAAGLSQQTPGKASVTSEGWAEQAMGSQATSVSHTSGFSGCSQEHPQGGIRALKCTPCSLVWKIRWGLPQKGNPGLWPCVVEVKS